MNRLAIVLLSVAAVLALGAARACAAQAAPAVGTQAPEISAQYWINSPPLSLAGLRGKIVVVEFWATWCGPCRISIPHLIELNKKYASQGVVFIGLTDEPRAVAEPFVRELGMNYAVGGGSKSDVTYAVTGIPHAFLVDANGVIAWAGHPMDGGFVAAIEATMKKTPPTMMTPAEKASVLALLDSAEAAIKKEQWGAAASMVGRIARPDDDPVVKERTAAARKVLADHAALLLAAAEESIKAKDYVKGSQALCDVAAMAPGSEPAAKASARLKELMADESIRAAIDEGRRERAAADLLAEVDRAAAKQAPAATLKALDGVAAKFAGTKSGEAAAERAKAMRADKQLMAKIQADGADKEAKSLLSMARSFLKSGMPEKAKPYIDQVIQKYPDTDYAKEAKALMEEAAKAAVTPK